MARTLIERSVSFNYDYPMHCSSCGDPTIVTAQDYVAITNSHIDCSSCGSDIHFGRAVAAIRDPADSSLEDAAVTQLAWYHTSTTEGWPLLRRAPLEYGRYARLVSAEGRREAQDRHADEALHVGTYEAAIESMVRRMRNEGDAASQFFLYRVALKSDLTIEPCYRDENHAEAAKITQTEIREAGVLAVRYLNVYEAAGSISLALCRETIESVQAVRVPLPDLGVPARDSLVADLQATQSRLKELAEQPRPAPRTALERLQAKADFRRPGPPLVRYTDEEIDLINEARERIADVLLEGISPVIRSDVEQAMGAWENSQPDPTPDDVVGGWAGMAILLSRSDAVIERLSAQPTRLIV